MTTPAVRNPAFFPPVNSPFLTGNLISNAWFQLLLSLYTRTGGATGDDVFDSGQIALAATVSQAHKLPAQPKRFRAVIQNVTAELGYTTGQEVDVTKHDDGTDGCCTGVDPTNIFWSCSNTALKIERKDTGARAAITPGNWALALRAGVRP
jgi:hypothetical protein